MISGGIAGITYVIIAHPFETAAVLLQLDDQKKPKYQGMIDCMSKVVKERGWLGLYRGVSPTLMRAFPSYAAAFYGYEGALKLVEG